MLGRHTCDSTQADVDGSNYRADLLGVSGVPASVERKSITLLLADLHSINHRFLNGRQLAEDEVGTQTNGDEVYPAEPGFTVMFQREANPQV